VAGLRRAHGLRGRHPRRDQATTDATHRLPVADYRRARDGTPRGPPQVWRADITDLWTDEGGRYLAIVLDLFNRAVVGGSLMPRRTANRVSDALTRGGL
jgi:putative transposase